MPADGTSPASVSADRLPPVANLYGRPLVVHKCALHKKESNEGNGNSTPSGITLPPYLQLALSALPLRRISHLLPAFLRSRSALGYHLPQSQNQSLIPPHRQSDRACGFVFCFHIFLTFLQFPFLCCILFCFLKAFLFSFFSNWSIRSS